MSNSEKRISKIFGWWCHKIIPLIYDDSLSYYELLCKLLAKLNEVIDTVNGILDGDIEGYLKNLIDEYTTQEVNELIDEIGETRVTEIAERIVAEVINDWATRLQNVEDSVENLDNELTPRVMTSGTKSALFNREHYLWCGNPDADSHLYDSNNQLLYKADLVLVDDTYFYYFINAGNNSDYFKIVKVNRGGYNAVYSDQFMKTGEYRYGSGHGTVYENYLATLDGLMIITLFNKGSNTEPITAPYFYKRIRPDSGNAPLGRIAYDSVTEKMYGCGTMRNGNNYTVYEIDLTITSDDTSHYSTTELFTYSPSVILGIPQNMCCHDGMLYVLTSNPNQIICVDINEQKVVNIINIGDRFDYIIPLGEAQGISYCNDKLFVSGYNSRCVSGISYLNAVGSFNPKIGNYINNQVLTRSPSDRTQYVFYVDRYPSNVTLAHNDHQLTYDRYKNACGWYGDYDYLPFYNLWEAVEASIGAFARTGIKARINLADLNNTGNAMTWGETVIPGWCISSIYGYKPQATGTVYATVRYLLIIGGTVEIHRIGFSGNRKSGTDKTAFIECEGGQTFLSDCALLRLSGNVVSENPSDFRNFMYTTNNGWLTVGTFHSPVSDFGHGGGNWLGDNMPSEVNYFAEANSGVINYGVSGNSGYVELDRDRSTAVGYVNLFSMVDALKEAVFPTNNG